MPGEAAPVSAGEAVWVPLMMVGNPCEADAACVPLPVRVDTMVPLAEMTDAVMFAVDVTPGKTVTLTVDATVTV